MSVDLVALTSNKALNGWRLFWLVSAPMSLLVIVKALGADLTTASGVSSMIQYSVRCAVPIIYLVVSISALQVLFPGALTKWLLRNRSYIGLCFGVAMAWQSVFIFIISVFFRDYYYEQVFYLRDELEGSTGYIFLVAMMATSFHFGRKHLTQSQWKLVHSCGIYFLWAYAFSVYWWNLSYYPDPEPIDYIFYWAGLLAFCLRIAAWGKGRIHVNPDNVTPVMFRVIGAALIGFGLVVASTGLYWQRPVTDFLLSPGWSAELVLWLPYWPFEPYLSILFIGMGTLLMTWHSASARRLPAELARP